MPGTDTHTHTHAHAKPHTQAVSRRREHHRCHRHPVANRKETWPTSDMALLDSCQVQTRRHLTHTHTHTSAIGICMCVCVHVECLKFITFQCNLFLIFHFISR